MFGESSVSSDSSVHQVSGDRSTQVRNALLFRNGALLLGVVVVAMLVGAIGFALLNRSDPPVAVLDAVPPASAESTSGGPDASQSDDAGGASTQGGAQSSAQAQDPAAPNTSPSDGSYAASNVKRVEVRLYAPGDLAVEHSLSRGDAEVTVVKENEDVEVEVGNDGDLLHVDTRCKRQGDPDCRAKVTLAVAPGTELDLYTAVGNVYVKDPTADLRIRSDVGSIALSQPQAHVDVGTGTGDIAIRDAGMGDYVVAAGVGQVSISVADKIASLDVSAGTGDIDIALPRSDTALDVRATTGVGKRRVDVATSSQGGTPITVEVGVGDVSVRYS